MGVVRLYMAMSLDGFIADRNGEVPLYPDRANLRESEALAEMIQVLDSPARTDIRYRVVNEG